MVSLDGERYVATQVQEVAIKEVQSFFVKVALIFKVILTVREVVQVIKQESTPGLSQVIVLRLELRQAFAQEVKELSEVIHTL